MIDQPSLLDLQNRNNRNLWYQVEKVSDREIIIRFPKDDETTLRVLSGTFRFVLMKAEVFENLWQERQGALMTGFMVGASVGLLVGILFGKLSL